MGSDIRSYRREAFFPLLSIHWLKSFVCNHWFDVKRSTASINATLLRWIAKNWSHRAICSRTFVPRQRPSDSPTERCSRTAQSGGSGSPTLFIFAAPIAHTSASFALWADVIRPDLRHAKNNHRVCVPGLAWCHVKWGDCAVQNIYITVSHSQQHLSLPWNSPPLDVHFRAATSIWKYTCKPWHLGAIIYRRKLGADTGAIIHWTRTGLIWIIHGTSLIDLLEIKSRSPNCS